MSMLHPYEDRKRLKWMGFYLSEHTAQIDQEIAEEQVVFSPKKRMEKSEISDILAYALLKSQAVTIQKNEVVNDHYLPDVTGTIQNYNEVGLYVDGQFPSLAVTFK